MAKILLCFGAGLEEQKEFQEFAQECEKQELQVHIVDNVQELDLRPHGIFNVLEHLWKAELDQHEYYFLSNLKDFFKLCYRILPNTFQEFIYWQDKTESEYNVEMEEIYITLAEAALQAKEGLSKKIFTNAQKLDFAEGFSAGSLASLQDFLQFQQAVVFRKKQQNIYCFAGKCYLIEPSSGEVCYIYLDENEIVSKKFADFLTPAEIEQKILQQAEDVFELLARDVETCLNRQGVLEKLFHLIGSSLLVAGAAEQKYYNSLLEAMSKGYGIYAEIYTLSFLLKIYKKGEFYQRLLDRLLETSELNPQIKYYIFSQLQKKDILAAEEYSLQILGLEGKLFAQICSEFQTSVEPYLENMPAEKLVKDNIMILVSQFIGVNQFQTFLALELAAFLMKEQQKNVTIINTCELLTNAGKVPVFEPLAAHMVTEYTKGNNIEYQGIKIPFVQMISLMPTIGGINGVADYLANEFCPKLVINLADYSVMSGLVSGYLPTVSVLAEESKVWMPLNGALVANGLEENVKEFYEQNKLRVLKFPWALNKESLNEQKEEFLAKLCELIV